MFFSYAFKAVLNINWKFEEDDVAGTWDVEDIALAAGG